VATGGPCQGRRARPGGAVIAIEGVDQDRRVAVAVEECSARTDEATRQVECQRDVDEARRAGEHVTGLGRIAGDRHRRAAVAREVTARDRRRRGRKGPRRRQRRCAVELVSTRRLVEAAMKLLLGDVRARAGVDEQRGDRRAVVRRLQQRAARRTHHAGHRKLEARPPADLAAHGEEAGDEPALVVHAHRRRDQRTRRTGGDDHQCGAHRRTVGEHERHRASVTTHAHDLTAEHGVDTERARPSEQSPLETADRHERDRRLREQLRDVGRQLGRAHGAHVLAVLALATLGDRRDDRRIVDVDTEAHEVRQVALAGYQELRTDACVLVGRRTALDEQRAHTRTRELDRDREADRAGADDRDGIEGVLHRSAPLPCVDDVGVDMTSSSEPVTLRIAIALVDRKAISAPACA
jgi:hypothetical protein